MAKQKEVAAESDVESVAASTETLVAPPPPKKISSPLDRLRDRDLSVSLGNLRGPDGNLYVVLGRVRKTMKRSGVPQDEFNAFMAEAEGARSYAGVLRVVKEFFHLKMTSGFNAALRDEQPISAHSRPEAGSELASEANDEDRG